MRIAQGIAYGSGGNAIVVPEKMNKRGKPSMTFKLTEVTAANGIEHDAAHTAMSDCLATLGVCRKLYRHHALDWLHHIGHGVESQLQTWLQENPLFVHYEYMFGRHDARPASVLKQPGSDKLILTADLTNEFPNLSRINDKAKLPARYLSMHAPVVLPAQGWSSRVMRTSRSTAQRSRVRQATHWPLAGAASQAEKERRGAVASWRIPLPGVH